MQNYFIINNQFDEPIEFSLSVQPGGGERGFSDYVRNKSMSCDHFHPLVDG